MEQTAVNLERCGRPANRWYLVRYGVPQETTVTSRCEGHLLTERDAPEGGTISYEEISREEAVVRRVMDR